jgi:hypothetical protein
MPNDHKIDIKMLEQKANSIRDALAKLFTDQDLRDLILHWRKPGWTTPAEFIFASAIVDFMHAQVSALTKLKGELIKGSEAVRPSGRTGEA